MDQEAFRKLLSSRPGGAQKQNGSQQPQHTRSLLPPKTKDDHKKPTSDNNANSKPAPFKPRKVKKQNESGYRDRATERRIGAAGDFAEVEAVLETFEKQHADEDKAIVEERRKYLGGDAEHSVLVKGLDFALLEQTKARLAASEAAQDDEELEEAFRETGAAVSSTSPLPSEQGGRKRTREDIVKELKNKRAKGEENPKPVPAAVEDKTIEEAKRMGKFKPIGGGGFRPIGATAKSKTKAGDGKEVKKKKKKKAAEEAAGVGEKVESGGAQAVPGQEKIDNPSGSSKAREAQRSPELALAPVPAKAEPIQEPEPELVNEDFDIFADAGDYEGINLGDDDDVSDAVSGISDDDRGRGDRSQESDDVVVAATAAVAGPPNEAPKRLPPEPRPKRKWIEDEEEEGEVLPHSRSRSREASLPALSNSKGKGKEPANAKREPDSPDSPRPTSPTPDIDTNAQSQPLTRLAPLASSAVPSIQDILAADAAREAEEKRKARKEKQKHKRGGGGGGEGEGEGKKVSKEAKLNREYQKLKSYTEKKGGGVL